MCPPHPAVYKVLLVGFLAGDRISDMYFERRVFPITFKRILTWWLGLQHMPRDLDSKKKLEKTEKSNLFSRRPELVDPRSVARGEGRQVMKIFC